MLACAYPSVIPITIAIICQVLFIPLISARGPAITARTPVILHDPTP
jgi:hypothetical protein